MRIGIDISQTAHEGTGVARIVTNLVRELVSIDKINEYTLFFSSMRRNIPQEIEQLKNKNNKISLIPFKIPPFLLDMLWNRLHIFPIERFVGDIDVFISSDWTEPPTVKAKKITILYDLVIYKYPEETANKIINVQKRKLKWTKKECDKIICISESTKKDAMEILGIQEDRLSVITPGI